MAFDLQRLRAETPGCAERIHLNNAGAALMPESVIRTIQEYIVLESRIGGYEAADASAEAVEAAYRVVADLVSAAPRNIAFTEHATASYVQALSSIRFERGDLILTTRNDYSSNQIQFLSLEKRLGIRVLQAPDRPEGGVDVQAMADLIARHRPRLVSVTHVPTNSGLVQDVAAVGALCRQHGAWYLVDACQSIGQMPVDARAIGCDFLSATSRKFLRGPRGAGFLYVSDRALEGGLEPLFIDMHGAEWTGEREYRPLPDAKRFETFEFSWALVLATGEAAQYAQAIGLGAIRDRINLLAGRLRRALAETSGVRIVDRGPELCGIVSVAIEGRDARDVMLALRERGINTSAQRRGHAVFDYDRKGITSTLRLSPHYYNTEDEIAETVAAIEEAAHAETRRTRR
ncbi:MAG TPA: aminotransferase class V-fold PLP-dependent enzyme [Vicinamibacterales bacterium]|jgi:selenocysteine lyase/cysteine desulfurase